MDFLQSIIIAIVEGLTEFLPISSTGHMIIAEKLLHVPDNDFTKVFTVAIQLGAILAVVVLYYKKFFNFTNLHFYAKLIIGVVPAIILGLLFSKKIDALLDSSTTVAIALIAGGIILLFVDKFFSKASPQEEILQDGDLLKLTSDGLKHSEKEVSYLNSFIIGIWQCVAMIPGVSRSAASIIGGMQQKLTRKAAAEFSFFLAVPTMLAATGYKLLKYYKETGGFNAEEIKLLAVGNLVAFLVAIVAIKAFLSFLKKYGFKVWGIYRIIAGCILLALIYSGYISA